MVLLINHIGCTLSLAKVADIKLISNMFDSV